MPQVSKIWEYCFWSACVCVCVCVCVEPNLTTVYVPRLKHILKHLLIEMDTNLNDCYCMDFGICMFIVFADVHRKSLQSVLVLVYVYVFCEETY